MASSSSLPQETGVHHHPYQRTDLPGPKGSYETRQVPGGLYVRVDMPGVPSHGLKLNKYSDTRTVTFTGRAPIVWDNLDSSERVYGGYVVLDQDPCQLDISCSVKNGCLRLFFPAADGALHSLSSKKQSAANHVDKLVSLDDLEGLGIDPDDPSFNPEAAAKFWADDKEIIEINDKLREQSFKDGISYRGPTAEQAQGFKGGNFAHVNPFLLSGEEGVYSQKVVDENGGDSLCYLRMDMPGVGDRRYFIDTLDGGKKLGYGGEGEKAYCYDEGGRRYVSMLYLKCSCCNYMRIKEYMKDGVLRLLVCKLKSQVGRGGRKYF